VDGYITIKQARKEILDVKRQQFYDWIKRGEIKAIRLNPGRKTSPYLIEKQSLVDFKEALLQPMAL
jgi:excisionase family DNA binding protein